MPMFLAKLGRRLVIINVAHAMIFVRAFTPYGKRKQRCRPFTIGLIVQQISDNDKGITKDGECDAGRVEVGAKPIYDLVTDLIIARRG